MIISIYSNTKGLGKTKYAINLAAAIHRVAGAKVVVVDMVRPAGDMVKLLRLEDKRPAGDLIDSGLGIDLFVGRAAGAERLDRLKKDYGYVIIDLPFEADTAVWEVFEQSDSVHFFVDSRMETLQKAHGFLADLRENSAEGLDAKVKVVVHRLNIFDKLSMEEISWLLKWDIDSVVPEPGMLEMLVDLKGVPLLLKSQESNYSQAVTYIAKKESGRLVGLALGSGAAFGFAHIGVLKVIEKEGIRVDMVSGSSIGALIAAMWGLGLDSAKMEFIARKLKKKINVMKLLDFTAPISGILAGKRLRRFLKRVLGEKTFDDVKIPVKIMVYDLANRETLVVEKGRLLDAVYKSIAVPGIFEPIVEKERMFIDGGVLDPVPVDILRDSGAKKVIAVNVLPGPQDICERNAMLSKLEKEEEAELRHGTFYKKALIRLKRFFVRVFTPNIFDVIMTSMQAMEYRFAEDSCRRADVSLHPVLSCATSIDFHLIDNFIKRGEEEAALYVKKMRELILR
ncbi:MAG: patatin-like phospholipase family protein [Candidatus Omnitrophota bacterium]